MYDPDLVIMDWMQDAESMDEGDPIFKAMPDRDINTWVGEIVKE